MEDFVAKTEKLLELERTAEVEQCREFLSAQIIQDSKRLESKGLCITKLFVSNQRIGLYGRNIITFTRGNINKRSVAKDLPHNRFTVGDIVGIYAHSRPLKDDHSGHTISGIICHISQHSISIASDSLTENLNLSVYNNNLKLIKLANDVTYRRLTNCLRCLKDAIGLPQKLFGEEALLPANENAKCGGLQEATACGINKFFNAHLNQSQRDAVLFALSRRDVAIIHGPPGTGKTTTLIEVILQHVATGCKVNMLYRKAQNFGGRKLWRIIANKHDSRQNIGRLAALHSKMASWWTKLWRISTKFSTAKVLCYMVLACAPSNIAVDNMVERLHQQKVKVVRLGHPARLVPWIQMCSLDAILSDSDSGAIVRDVRTDIDLILTKLKETQPGTNRRQLWKELKYLKKELHIREERAIKDLLTSADVVLSTNVGASSDGPIKCLPDGHFSLVVIDECAQALELSCWIPLLLANKCVLAGDHQQLPPTIISDEAAKEGLSISLMERLHKLYGDEITSMLQVQYRMNAAIMEPSSKYFYNNNLMAAKSVSCHVLSDLPNTIETSITSIPLLFIDTNGCDLYELETEESDSKGNEGEADLVSHYIKCLIEANIEPNSIAVIAPYNLQVELIRQRIHSTFDTIEVKTVDGFQGREKEAVILSLTRSNKKGEVGFLSEQRRSNVAITRARRHLAIIGDSSTISHEPFLKELLEHISSVGEVQSAFDYIHDTEFQQHAVIKQPKPLRTHKTSTNCKSPVHQCKPKRMATSNVTSKLSVTSEPAVEKVKDMEDSLVKFKNAYREELVVFVGSKDKMSIDYPPSLSSLQRKALHEVAEEMNLEHVSHGSGVNRHICVSKPLSNTNSPSSEVNIEDDDTVDNAVSERSLTLNDQNSDVKSVRSDITHKHKKKKPKSLKGVEIKVKEDNDDDLLDLYIKNNNVCSYSGCMKNIKLLGQTCKFCCKLFCLSHHQAELHGCGEEAKIAARKESLQKASEFRTLNHSKRKCLQKQLEKNINDLKSKQQPKKQQ